jgi:hypothetical protein
MRLHEFFFFLARDSDKMPKSFVLVPDVVSVLFSMCH